MPATAPWFTGAQVPLTWVNTDTNGNPQDAASLGSVSCTVVQPDGTTVTVTPVNRTGTGTYQPVFTSTQAGHHVYVFVSTDSTYPGTFTDSFEVWASPDSTIVSLAEAKEILHLTSTTAQDAKIQGHNAAVTNVVEYFCGPVIVRTVVEKLIARGNSQVLSKAPVIELLPWAGYPPALAASGITIPSPPSPMFPAQFYGIAYPTEQLFADPRTGIVTHTSNLPFMYGSYVWQYKAGRPVIPGCIYDASKIILKHLYMVETTGAGTGTGAGDEETTIPTPFGFAIPNRAYELMRPELAASSMAVA